MQLSRLLAGLSAFAGLAVLLGGPGCSSNPKASTFSGGGDAGGDATTEAGPMLNFDAHFDTGLTGEGGFNDGMPEFDATGCVADAGGPGPLQHICVIYPSNGDDNNECDGHHDLPGFPANGTGGNGFDDNCNGLVDEGCACGPVGTTKTCYLVPESQTAAGLPVGWCTQNSKGTVDCQKPNEESPAAWSGVCRGAQPPFADDFCAPGDFNCDGKEENSSTQNCSCKPGTVQCPTQPLTTVPYPSPSALPLKVDAAAWIPNPSDLAGATGWKWKLLGGDCDNILPHPTFGIYATQDGTGNPVGAENDTLGMSGMEHGTVAIAPNVHSSIYPAFSLSGDYSLEADWQMNGQQYSCLVKIQVRAPGLRAEACWSTENQNIDLDLHMSKVDFPQCSTSHDWSDSVCAMGEDCYYNNCYTPNGAFPDWGYPDSPASACVGWGAQAGQAVSSCGNPRLDRDANGLSGECDPSVTNPNAPSPNFSGGFCGPENINLDQPGDGERYAIAVRYFGDDSGADNGLLPSPTHVNVYCDGVRILSTGYDPITGSNFPKLITPGADETGDMWKVGIVTTHVTATGLNCDIAPTQSMNPHMATDGSTSFCVDDTTTDTMASAELLTSGGLEPLDGNALCFH